MSERLLMKIRLLIVILISAGFFLMVSSYTNHQNGQGREEKEYQFLTQDFLSALEKLNSDAFFQSSQNDFKKRQLSYVRAIHYEKVAQKLCEDISDTFLEILDNEITDHNIFYLTNELNSALEKKGGYILPLHSTQGYLNAPYQEQKLLF